MMTSLLKWVKQVRSPASLSRFCSAAKSTLTDTTSDGYQKPSEASIKPFSDIPGEKGWPLIGSTKLLTSGGVSQDGSVGKDTFLYKQHDKYGRTFKMRTLGNTWIVFANGPEANAAVFRAEGKYPTRAGWFEKTMDMLHKRKNWPTPLVFAVSDNWKRLRSAMGKQVIPRRVGNLTPMLCEVTDDLLAHLEEISSRDNGLIEDIRPIITKWAIQANAYFVFGEKLNVYDDSDPTQKEFESTSMKFTQAFFDLSPLNALFPTKSYRNFIKAARRMRQLARQIMEKKVLELGDEIAKGTVDETKAVGILEQWLIEGKLEPEDALTQACDLLSGGFDTTRNTSIFLLFELAKQPALQDQLYHEIKAVLGDKANPSWEDLQNIPLVRSCLKETMRLYPPLLANSRIIQENAIVNGYDVPAGTLVVMTSQCEEYFDQPDKFIPERWSKDSEKPIDPFTSLPFGFGPRGCYGRRLAELEVYVLLTKIISRYHLTTDKDTLELIQHTFLQSNEPVPLVISERSA